MANFPMRFHNLFLLFWCFAVGMTGCLNHKGEKVGSSKGTTNSDSSYGLVVVIAANGRGYSEDGTEMTEKEISRRVAAGLLPLNTRVLVRAYSTQTGTTEMVELFKRLGFR